jgi:cytochrome c oxidase subunit 4
MLLTFATVTMASIDLGRWNTAIAISIAVCKALLVILYFMHARYSSRLVWLFIGAGFFWFVLLMALTFSDFASRNWVSLVEAPVCSRLC